VDTGKKQIDLEEIRMNIEIQNSKEDQYGNIKENVFLAFDDKVIIWEVPMHIHQ
jgi:hypothetical protein